ncbi:MAG: hypothetical protein ABW167_07225 [Baekduia sp.]
MSQFLIRHQSAAIGAGIILAVIALVAVALGKHVLAGVAGVLGAALLITLGIIRGDDPPPQFPDGGLP